MTEALGNGPEVQAPLPLVPLEDMIRSIRDEPVPLVFHDQRVVDEGCNLACGYCAPSGFPMRLDREGQAHMPEGWRETVIDLPVVNEVLPKNPQLTDFVALGSKAIEAVRSQADVKILKLSGGEITLYPKLVEYIKDVHQNYEAVQILTNGLKLTAEQIDAFGEMGNIFFQISLDGTTTATNRARTPNGRLTEKVMGNIRYVAEKGIPMEINCVLTSHNTGSIDTVLDDLKGLGDIIVVPRPVRGDGRKLMNFTAEQLEAFKAVVLGRFEEYRSILPPKPYLERLVGMMENGVRADRCYVPFFVQGVDNYGTAEMCSCGGNLPRLGNVLDSENEVFDKHREGTNYDPGGGHDDCSYCMTQYEIMNLYVEGKIDRDDMLRIPTFRYNGILDQVEKIGQRLRTKGILPGVQVEG